MSLIKYVGIPFEDRGASYGGADCYGLICLIYEEELGITIPRFSDSCLHTKNIYLAYLRDAAMFWDRVEEPRVFDVVAMAYDPKHPNIVQHFGIITKDGRVLHTLNGVGAIVSDIKDLQVFIKGIYRWKALS